MVRSQRYELFLGILLNTVNERSGNQTLKLPAREGKNCVAVWWFRKLLDKTSSYILQMLRFWYQYQKCLQSENAGKISKSLNQSNATSLNWSHPDKTAISSIPYCRKSLLLCRLKNGTCQCQYSVTAVVERWRRSECR